MTVSERDIECWREEIKRGDPPLGAFNWPYVLSVALDEIERLRGNERFVREQVAQEIEADAEGRQRDGLHLIPWAMRDAAKIARGVR